MAVQRWRALDYSVLYKEIVSFFLVSVYTGGKKMSALARNSSSREVIRKYVTSVLRAHSLQTAACIYSDDCVIKGGSTAI